MVRQVVWVVYSFVGVAAGVPPEDFCDYLECAVDVVGHEVEPLVVLATDVVAANELVRVAALDAAYELVRAVVLAAAYEFVRVAVPAAVCDPVQWMSLAAAHEFHLIR